MNLLESGEVIAGFRPEHFLPANLVPGNKVGFRFCVKNLEYLGSERILYGSLEGGRFEQKEVIARIPSTLQSDFVLDAVSDFAVAEPNLKFFDRSTEKRIQKRDFQWT